MSEKLEPKYRDKVIELYNTGLTCQQIARKLRIERHVDHVWKHLWVNRLPQERAIR